MFTVDHAALREMELEIKPGFLQILKLLPTPLMGNWCGFFDAETIPQLGI